MTIEPFVINPGNFPAYLHSRRLIPSENTVNVRELGGGVSNIVLSIEWLDDPGRSWVAKQSLGKLRVKDDWRSDRERIFREAESIQSLRPVLGEGALPEVIHVDRENFLFVMTAAPAGSAVWKDLLMGRRADLALARQAALLLARMINGSRTDASFQKSFGDCTVFDQLRIDPYYRTTAARHPDVRSHYEELIGTSLKIQTALVHGDYSPKNMLVRGHNIFLIDFEVIHWGDPAFDSGFLLNHLFLKAFHQPPAAHLYLGLAREFWHTLLKALDPAEMREFERMTFLHLGGLMLARIDGKSPVEYVRDDHTKILVRRSAKRILQERPQTLEDVISLLAEGAKAADEG